MKLIKKVGLLLFTIMPAVAFADYSCKGEVNFVGLRSSGTVVVNGPGGLPSIYVCNVQTEANGINPETCKAMYSTLLAAEASGKVVNITFKPDPSEGCGGFTPWTYAENLTWVIRQD